VPEYEHFFPCSGLLWLDDLRLMGSEEFFELDGGVGIEFSEAFQRGFIEEIAAAFVGCG
jgi:hypothetical protein